MEEERWEEGGMVKGGREKRKEGERRLKERLADPSFREAQPGAQGGLADLELYNLRLGESWLGLCSVTAEIAPSFVCA